MTPRRGTTSRYRDGIGIAIGLALCVPLVATSPRTLEQTVAAPYERLTGTWMLDRDRSSVPPMGGGRDQPAGAGRGGRGGPGGRRGGGMGPGSGQGGPGGGGFGGGRGARMDPERVQAAGRYIRALSQPSNRLTIVATGDAVTITDLEGRSQVLKTDGKAIEEKVENGLVTVKRSAKWAAAVFSVTIETKDGPKVERRYEVSEGGTELRLSTHASGGRGPGRGTDRDPVVAVYTRSPD